MIKNTDAVKILAQAKKIATGEIQVKIERWVQGIGWAHMDMYFTQDEFERFYDILGAASVHHHSNRR